MECAPTDKGDVKAPPPGASAASTAARALSVLPLVALSALGLSWAVRLLAISELSSRGASSIQIAIVATAGIVVLLTLINLARVGLPPVKARHLRFYLLAGIFGFGAPFLLEITVAPHLPPLLFVIVVTSTPIWTLLVAASLRLEPLRWPRALAIIIGFGATALVILGTRSSNLTDGSDVEPLWILAALGIPALYAGYVLYIASAWPSDLDALQGAHGQATVALVAFACLWPFLPDRSSAALTSTLEWPVLIIIGAEVVALVLLFHLARTQGGSFATQANYVAVVAGAFLGIMLLDQPIDAIAIMGVALLVLALRLSTRIPPARAS